MKHFIIQMIVKTVLESKKVDLFSEYETPIF
jgi:hypothetical protein